MSVITFANDLEKPHLQKRMNYRTALRIEVLQILVCLIGGFHKGFKSPEIVTGQPTQLRNLRLRNAIFPLKAL
jgi:hypothetical protein